MSKRFLIPLLAGISIFPLQAGAWVGYHGGGFMHGPRGGAAAWHRGGWGYHGGGAVFRGPAIPHGGPLPPHGGCWGCAVGAAAAAGAVGLAAGAAIGSAAAAASTPTPVIQQPVYVASPAIGSTVVSLPSGCTSATVNGARYYGCNGTYYKPHFGSSSVYYTVVPNPF